MVEAVTVSVEVRERTGKGAARAQRRAGRIPAVIYGDKQDPITISVDDRELAKLFHSPRFFTQIFELNLDGEKHQVLARDLQVHPVTDGPLHVDFMRFNQETRIVLLIPAKFINDELSPGLKRGGVLNIVRREVELLCSPLNIPGELVFDLEGLDIGDAIHIGATELPEDVATTTDRDFTVATIAAPTLMPSDEEEAESEEGEEGEEGMDGEEGVDGEGVSEDTAVPDPSDDGANSND